jgi:hypothetical protein
MPATLSHKSNMAKFLIFSLEKSMLRYVWNSFIPSLKFYVASLLTA